MFGRARMSRRHSRSSYARGRDRLHKRNTVNAGLVRGGNRL